MVKQYSLSFFFTDVIVAHERDRYFNSIHIVILFKSPTIAKFKVCVYGICRKVGHLNI